MAYSQFLYQTALKLHLTLNGVSRGAMLSSFVRGHLFSSTFPSGQFMQISFGVAVFFLSQSTTFARPWPALIMVFPFGVYIMSNVTGQCTWKFVPVRNSSRISRRIRDSLRNFKVRLLKGVVQPEQPAGGRRLLRHSY